MDEPRIADGGVTEPLARPPVEPPAGAPTGYAWDRLEHQLGWYGRSAKHNKVCFQRLKVAQIVAAAAIPVSAGAGASAWITGSMGAFIVVLEALQQLFQFQQHWTGYRSTAEALKHEKHLYLARARPYAERTGADALLAERVERLVAQEHAGWVSTQAEARGTGKT